MGALTHLGYPAVAIMLSLMLAACGDSSSPAALETSTIPHGVSADSVSPVPTRKALPEGYYPEAIMFAIYGGPGQSADEILTALRSALDAGDTSQVPVINEISRFLSDPVLAAISAEVLKQLTGQDFGIGGQGWLKATEWIGKRRDEYRPPNNYLKWKINLLSSISDRYRVFLGDADETARIDLTELVWGGVRPDGIPDLQFPPTLSADQADYLGSDERVFGVSINGEHRAYPLRIMNPHEMANDVLGGEPIALAY